MTDSAVLGGVAEVVSSNPRWVIEYCSAFAGIVDLLYVVYIVRVLLEFCLHKVC